MSVTLNQVLDAINAGLGVIKQVASTPGLNVLPYVSTIASAAGALQAAEAAGRDIAPYITAISGTFSGTQPTADDLAALDAKIAELDAQVDAPLPVAEPGEPN